jgi:hypothetical protein
MTGQLGAREEGQAGVVVLVVSLLIVGVLTAVLLGTTLDGGSNGTAGNPGVGLASDVQAKASLSEAQTAAQSALAAGGGVSITGLQAAEPSLQFTSGPSTGPEVISVSAAAASGGGVTVPGAGAVSVPGAAASGGSGAVLAVHSTADNCWLVYLGGAVPWFGEQTGQTSCTAPALSGPPTAGPVSSTAIGWQQGSFPVP